VSDLREEVLHFPVVDKHERQILLSRMLLRFYQKSDQREGAIMLDIVGALFIFFIIFPIVGAILWYAFLTIVYFFLLIGNAINDLFAWKK
jgi:predicted membrane protein